MAAFGASWCGVHLPRSEPVAAVRTGGTRAAPDAAGRAVAPVAAGQGEAPEPLAAFVADLVKSERPTAFKVLFSAYVSRCEAAGEAPKSKRALALALGGEQFVRSNLKGGEVHYGAQLRKRLAVVNWRVFLWRRQGAFGLVVP